LIKFENNEAAFSAPNKTATTRLKNSVLKNKPEYDAELLTQKDVLKRTLKGSESEVNAIIDQILTLDKNDYVTKTNNDLCFLNNDKIREVLLDQENLQNKLPKVLFIDEVTNFGTPMLQYLNMLANSTGTKIITLGDEAQLGLINTIDDVICRGSIKLAFSMRYTNTHKGFNDDQIGYFLQETINSKVTPNDDQYIKNI
jgi:hypothetical protein